MRIRTAILIIASISLNASLASYAGESVKVLLMGDSTTEGGKPVFEESIETIVGGVEGMPSLEVINVGKGGETAFSLLDSGRYDREIKGIKDVDYIFFRYGINDWFHRQPVEENFPGDMKKALDQVREDFPGAKLVLMTIIPFVVPDKSRIINTHIARIAEEEGLDLFDIYPGYQQKIDELGEFSMTVRFFPLDGIPAQYRELVAPYTRFYNWKNAEWVRVNSNEFDPLFGHLPGWYKDKHPNTTGYRFLAHETAKYLIRELKDH